MKIILSMLLLFSCRLASAAWGANYDLDALPITLDGFKVMFVAKEPELMHEVCMCFDAKGRLMVGGGAQFRWPKPETPKDKIKILIDKDGDGKTDEIKIFAEGFNCIQALAWKGNDLWVCHAPAVTIVRDLDGDDSADEFVDVYTDLGPLRHGLHGFNWGPDGKLYMSQGNNTCTKKAPKPWRDLMHVESNEPDTQPLRKYTKAEWKAEYLTPYNDESEGGVLRCDPDGTNLEIFARGMRNPWDIAFDSEFTWIGGDNDDGPEHDRVFRFFDGADMGHKHPWGKSWMGADSPGVPPSSALFPDANGSAVGTVFYTSDHFPPEYRHGFFMGDSDGERVYFFKPTYDGAQTKVELKPFLKTTAIGKSALFMPTDVEVAPDGSLYVISWGSTYGSKWAPYHKGRDEAAKINEGRVFRIWHEKSPLISRETYFPAKRSKKYAEWTVAELLEDMGHQIPVWRVNAQDELVRRGAAVQAELIAALNGGKLTTAQETWTLWAVGRIGVGDKQADKIIEGLFDSKNLNQRIQAFRIAAIRKMTDSAPIIAKHALDAEPRVRFEVAQALHRLKVKSTVEALVNAAAAEKDRVVLYAQWRALQDTAVVEDLKKVLTDARGTARQAALLALLGSSSLKAEEVLPFLRDSEVNTRLAVRLWLAKNGSDLPSDTLIAMLADPDADTRKTALTCLSKSKLSEAAYAKLEEMMQKAKGDERASLLAALSSDTRSIKLVWAELGAEDKELRQAAIDGIAKHDKEIPKLLAEGGEKLANRQREGAIIALSSVRKPQWTFDAALLKNVELAYASGDVTARRSVLVLLDKTKDLKKNALATQTGKLAQKASIDTDPDVRKTAANVCKVLGVEVAQRDEGTETKIEQVIPLIAKGDPNRGKEIFFKSTIGCFNCHQLEGKGTAIGPDLSDIGLRAEGKIILESVLDPSKVIIEGFQPTLIKSKDGALITGLVKDESDEAVWIVDSTGKRTEIHKREISLRKSLNVSFMPDNFNELLKPQDAADLINWLSTLKTPRLKP